MADAEVKEKRILVAVDEGDGVSTASFLTIPKLPSNFSTPSNLALRILPSMAQVGENLAKAISGNKRYLLSSDIIATMDGYNDEVANAVIGKASKKN
ncbi:hypothetical protein RJ641_020768 [Dillenia turbinata]|uniref:Uncharacterized protein n=1 Tax=Dillenia turbinata TaxID=194707 RepID=A0AAN8UPQ1_9MAGN